MEEAAKEAAKVAEEAAKGQRRRSVVQGDTIMMEERKPKSGCNDMAFHCWECCGGTLLFLGAIAGIVYLTHLVVSSDEKPGSSLSPPSSPPQPLLPPSALPSPHYLSSLAVGLIGGAMLCFLCCLSFFALFSGEIQAILLVIYPACFSLFMLLGLTQNFKKCISRSNRIPITRILECV